MGSDYRWTQEKRTAKWPRDLKVSRLTLHPFTLALAVSSVSALPRLNWPGIKGGLAELLGRGNKNEEYQSNWWILFEEVELETQPNECKLAQQGLTGQPYV